MSESTTGFQRESQGRGLRHRNSQEWVETGSFCTKAGVGDGGHSVAGSLLSE